MFDLIGVIGVFVLGVLAYKFFGKKIDELSSKLVAKVKGLFSKNDK